MAEPEDLLDEIVKKGEEGIPQSDISESDQIRRAFADAYTFVRSSEINKTIASFSLDHYIDEAKREIKDPRILRAASEPTVGIGTRPSKLEALEKLESDFAKAVESAKTMLKVTT